MKEGEWERKYRQNQEKNNKSCAEINSIETFHLQQLTSSKKIEGDCSPSPHRPERKDPLCMSIFTLSTRWLRYTCEDSALTHNSFAAGTKAECVTPDPNLNPIVI